MDQRKIHIIKHYYIISNKLSLKKAKNYTKYIKIYNYTSHEHNKINAVGTYNKIL